MSGRGAGIKDKTRGESVGSFGGFRGRISLLRRLEVREKNEP